MIEIKLPIIKISTNAYYAGKHFMVRKKHKDSYIQLTNGFKKYSLINEKVDLDFKFYFKSRALDSSNCSAMVKLYEDCLVKHGVLKDDTIKYVGKVSMESLKGNDDYVVITIKRTAAQPAVPIT